VVNKGDSGARCRFYEMIFLVSIRRCSSSYGGTRWLENIDFDGGENADPSTGSLRRTQGRQDGQGETIKFFYRAVRRWGKEGESHGGDRQNEHKTLAEVIWFRGLEEFLGAGSACFQGLGKCRGGGSSAFERTTRMSGEKFSDLIREFALTRSESFDFGALAEYVEKKVKRFDDAAEERLWDLACESDWLFKDERELPDRFIPRHVAFKGAEFRVTPLAEEVEGGFLVPGHRLMPYLSHEVFPGKVLLKLPDGSAVPTRQVQMPVAEVHRFLLFFGQFGAVDYLLSDSEVNELALLPPFDGAVAVTVFDLKPFFVQCGFKPGDSLMLTVEDWQKGVYSVLHVPVQKGAVDFAETHGWTQALRAGFGEALPDAGLDHDCNEQMARMLWLAECNEDAPSVLSNPPLSLAAFFNMQKDLTVQTSGQVSFFWPKDEPIESRMMNSLATGDLEPESELDAYFSLLGLSLNSDEAEAYMRDALARGCKKSDEVLARVIQGRVLHFPTAEEQKEFNSLWCELWDEVRGSYDPRNDSHREMRSVFLDLNDQCLGVLRELDRNLTDPSAILNNPAHLQMGELSGLIGSALLMCNQSGEPPEEFTMPLDEMVRDISAAISELSGQLNKGKTLKGDFGGPIYQLKISLKQSKPPVWRRLLVPADIELHLLHEVIQAAFGWTNSHLHQFIDGRTFYQPGAEDDGFMGMESVNSIGVPLKALLRREKEKVVYEYDFGDSWEHVVQLEKVLPADPKQPLPVCIKGKRACPPEDCGGVFGYFQMLETLDGPDCDEKEQLLDWLGAPIDPEAFDLEEINVRIQAWC